jgi:protein-disulfide isomerase
MPCPDRVQVRAYTKGMRFLVVLAFAAAMWGQNQAPVPAFDAAAFEQYVRYLNVFDETITVKVAAPAASAKLPGFREVTVTASRGEASITQLYLLSPDGERVVRGDVFELSKSPFASEKAKLVTAGLPSYGAPGAPVDMVIFSDFQCPVCKKEADVIRQNVSKAFPNEVRVYFHDFPLESIHNWARQAAVGSRCVLRVGPLKWWDFHDAMFQAQENLNAFNLREKMLEWVKAKSVDEAQFTACFDGAQTNGEVQKEIERAQALGVDRTPTLFVNGRKVTGALDWPALSNLILFELKAAKAATTVKAADANNKECCELKVGGVK